MDLRLRRPADEQTSEFLASSDSWFRPIHLAHGPDGAIWIVDMYREIIEDYSAIPRYLQQQYGLTNGMFHGRLWRLSHEEAPEPPPADISRLNRKALTKEIASPHLWRRKTARRLLIEQNARSSVGTLSQLVREKQKPATVLNALYTLDSLNGLSPEDVLAALEHPDISVRVHGLRLSESWLDSTPKLLQHVSALKNEKNPRLLLQLALTLGESRNPQVLPTLASLARQ